MSRVAHVYLASPWEGAVLVPSPEAVHHLTRVLRVEEGERVSYTDGSGTVGVGRWLTGAVERGAERNVPAPRRLIVALAAPRARERQRFAVEKLSEIGVTRLTWLATRRGEGRPPPEEKASAWAVASLEQSRGAHLMSITGPDEFDALERPLAVADPGAARTGLPLETATVAIGPEGGFDPDEVPADAHIFGLGERILRTETAAIVVAAAALLV